MNRLVRPRRVGFGDASDPLYFFDPGSSGGTVPPATGNNSDFGDLSLGMPESPAAAAAAAVNGNGGPFSLTTAANDVVKGAQTWFGAQTAVNNANYASQLAKARAQAAVAQAKAGGANAAAAAGAGLPSPTLILAAGVALGAVLLLRRK